MPAPVAKALDLHQAPGGRTYGLDHGERTAWPMQQDRPNVPDILIVTTGRSHLVGELAPMQRMLRCHPAKVDQPPHAATQKRVNQ